MDKLLWEHEQRTYPGEISIDLKNAYDASEYANTDVAVETADVVLVKNDPSDAWRSVQLARKVRRKIKQNLFWAAIYNLIAIPIAAGIFYPSPGLLLRPEWAALAMNASTITVTLNALLLNSAQLQRKGESGSEMRGGPVY